MDFTDPVEDPSSLRNRNRLVKHRKRSRSRSEVLPIIIPPNQRFPGTKDTQFSEEEYSISLLVRRRARGFSSRLREGSRWAWLGVIAAFVTIIAGTVTVIQYLS